MSKRNYKQHKFNRCFMCKNTTLLALDSSHVNRKFALTKELCESLQENINFKPSKIFSLHKDYIFNSISLYHNHLQVNTKNHNSVLHIIAL